MENLFVLDDRDYPEGLVEICRVAVRGIIFLEGKLLLIQNEEGRIKLPGGGIEQGEDDATALIREVREETGYEVKPETIIPFGETEEKRMMTGTNRIWHQISRMYLCEVRPEQGNCAYTESEIRQGFRQVSYTLDEAIQMHETMLEKIGTKNGNRREYKVLLLLKAYLSQNDK